MLLKCDVAVIGAGFTGLTAARELSRREHRVVLLEARDRIGGRTWVDHRLGADLELGGQWVHWCEPHIWAELTRYGLGITKPSPGGDPMMHWSSPSGMRTGTAEEYGVILDNAIDKFLADVDDVFPMPFDPYHHPMVATMDALALEPMFQHCDLNEDESVALRTLARGMFSSASFERIAYTDFVRKLASMARTLSEYQETQGTYSIEGGTRQLATAITADSAAIQLLSNPVLTIEHSGTEVTIKTRDYLTVKSSVAVVTVPLNALKNIAFHPALSPGRDTAVQVGSECRGWKMWGRLKGHWDPFTIVGRLDAPLGSAHVYDYVDGDTIVVAFGSDASEAIFESAPFMESCLSEWLPQVQVVGAAGHNWVADEYAGQTWRARQPLVLTRDLPVLRAPEGQLVFAGSDYSLDPLSTMSSAIGQGLEAAAAAEAAYVHEPPGASRWDTHQPA